MELTQHSRRAQLHYLVTLVVIVIYGVQVCPFIESLGWLELIVPLLLVVLLQYVFHHRSSKWLVSRLPYKRQVARLFQYEWAIFVISGGLFTLYNTLINGFPVGSGLKMIVGFSAIGFFVATDLALERERMLAGYIRDQGIRLTPDERFFTLVAKFTLFASMTTLFVVLIFFLLINKDLMWLADALSQRSFAEAQRAILVEFLFVGLILLSYSLLIIRSYAANLHHYIHSENEVLHQATTGDLTHAVTVSSNDEFGVMAHKTNQMIAALRQRNQELQTTQDVTILSLASLAETRDNETGAHILRTQRYVKALAEQLKSHPEFSDFLNAETIDLLFKSAPLHDIGKVGIPDAILLKPGKLSDEEFVIMKTHAELGGKALIEAEQALGGTSFLTYAREIAETHHEKWDGSGYPKRLKGRDIPISGRLMAVADVYDALISKRVYKPAFSHDKAVAIIREGKGQHFDPAVVEAMFSCEHTFKRIAAEFSDKAAE